MSDWADEKAREIMRGAPLGTTLEQAEAMIAAALRAERDCGQKLAETAVLKYPEWPCPWDDGHSGLAHQTPMSDGICNKCNRHAPDCLRAELEARK